MVYNDSGTDILHRYIDGIFHCRDLFPADICIIFYTIYKKQEESAVNGKSVVISKRDFFVDYLLSIVLELVILFGLMAFCSLFIYKGELVQTSELVGDEMSSPTTGRLIYMILSFVLALLLCIAASECSKRDKDIPAFWCGYASGILLWQALGEEAWHFSISGIHFVQLESIASFPVVLMFIGLIVYGSKHGSFDWGIWCMILSFACNWLGHYITVGLYPFVESLIESHTWNVLAGSIGGAAMFIISILYLLFRAVTRKDRMFASMLTYIAIGCTALSIIDG